ncbi:MAG: twin-arginine translocase subunit TatC [Planctomycetota bacterium]|nr:twin-arginine translocase subunit TatC [Planctomycetota bacterium]
MSQSKDLFDDSSMTFGEHLEVLRVHIIKGLFGLVIGVIVALIFGHQIIAFIRQPIDNALQSYAIPAASQEDDLGGFNIWDYTSSFFSSDDETPANDVTSDVEIPDSTATKTDSSSSSADGTKTSAEDDLIELTLPADRLINSLRRALGDSIPLPTAESLKGKTVPLIVRSPLLAALQREIELLQIDTQNLRAEQLKPVTLTVEEAFMTYLKVSFVAGLILSSPWLFYQIWLFVAVGLYPHERGYVKIYLPMSLGLFITGAVFCYYAVFPLMLSFLLEYNRMLGVTPQIRLSEWITFAILFPAMFGISFQLPLVMLFLERISIFDVQAYREKRRIAILTIAIASMFLTPSGDPASMTMMMIPLLLLYELGIYLCKITQSKKPFVDDVPA